MGRFHALVEINKDLPPEELHAMHAPVLENLEPLIRRGQRDGTFRDDVAPAWHLKMILALIHAASAEIDARGASPADIEPALVATVLGAVGVHPAVSRRPGRGPSSRTVALI